MVEGRLFSIYTDHKLLIFVFHETADKADHLVNLILLACLQPTSVIFPMRKTPSLTAPETPYLTAFQESGQRFVRG